MKIQIIALILLLKISFLFAEAPVVENVRFEQRTDGSLVVDIYYDATDAEGDLLEISIEASNDKGVTWTLPCTSLTGDIGEGVVPGPDKQVVWDFHADNPGVSGDGYRVRVRARDIVIDIDGNVYDIVSIGEQDWIVQNLKVTHYRNGDPIEHVTDNSTWADLSTGAYCAYNNEESNADTYGYLYNWYAVNDSRNIAPEGWHVPTDEEWKTLEQALGMSQSEADDTGYRGTDEGSKLADRADLWTDGNLENNTAFGESGFSALPAGYRDYYGLFDGLGSYALFWSSTEYSSGSDDAWGRHLYSDNSAVSRNSYDKQYGFSIRLVRDLWQSYKGMAVITGRHVKKMQLSLLNQLEDNLLTDLFQAYFDARKNKRNTINALVFEKHFESNLFNLYNELICQNYEPGPSICFIVTKPVKREIFAASFRDRVIHHYIYNKISPVFEKLFIHDS